MNRYRNTFKPYLINAFYTWSMDIGFTPLIEIENNTANHSKNKIPEALKNREAIVFNIHPHSISNLVFGKDCMEFEARILNESYNISIYHDTIKKIFSKEDGYGLEFNIMTPQNITTPHQMLDPSINNINNTNNANHHIYHAGNHNENHDNNTPSGVAFKPLKQKGHLILIKND